MAKSGPNKCKITIKELEYIKYAQDNGIDRPEIKKITGLSHFIVTSAMNGKYDHLLSYRKTRQPDIPANPDDQDQCV